MPLGTLSVIMPNYNHARFIPLSLGAVLEQSCRPLEVVVVDDCSTDNSVEVIESFVRRDPIVKLVRNERNLGFMETVTRHTQSLRGEYMFIPSADDFILPGFFEKSLRLLAEHPDAGLSFAFGSQFDGATGKVRPQATDLSSEPCYLPPGKWRRDIADVSRATRRSSSHEIRRGGELPRRVEGGLRHVRKPRAGVPVWGLLPSGMSLAVAGHADVVLRSGMARP